MKIFLSIVLLFQASTAISQSSAKYVSAYFDRPLSCPLRFSNLAQLRDQVQAVTATLGNTCTQSDQAAINQLNASVANLESIASTWATNQGDDQKAQNAQLAKNASKVLGSLDIITSSESCFYDIRSRGAFPVVADIVMSLSQVGLLIPSTMGTLVATGGYLAGSGLQIINELVKKRFNWNRPEERRAFLQLNCAFFDNRRVMEEMGLFNPETKSFRDNLAYSLKKERTQLIKMQKELEASITANEKALDQQISNISEVSSNGLNPSLSRKLDELNVALSARPADYAGKWKQVSVLAILAPEIKAMLEHLKLDGNDALAVKIMLNNVNAILPDLVQDGKAWSSTIDEYEIKYRGPVLAFSSQISEAIKKAISFEEAVNSGVNKSLAKSVSMYKVAIKEMKIKLWSSSQRLLNVEAKIASLEQSDSHKLFSQTDEGKSDAVEILDNYRILQSSILGKEGKGYLENSMDRMEDVHEALQKHLALYSEANGERERCSAAEKLKFVWAQYRYKAQESYDFVTTNLDLYRSSYKIGKEKQKKSTFYVLDQIASVEEAEAKIDPMEGSVGYYMNSVTKLIDEVEGKLEASGCY